MLLKMVSRLDLEGWTGRGVEAMAGKGLKVVVTKRLGGKAGFGEVTKRSSSSSSSISSSLRFGLVKNRREALTLLGETVLAVVVIVGNSASVVVGTAGKALKVVEGTNGPPDSNSSSSSLSCCCGC